MRYVHSDPTHTQSRNDKVPSRTARFSDESREFRLGEDLSNSPLASVLCSIEGVARVYFGPDFITVTKSGVAHDWQHLKAPILAAIMDHFTSAQPLYLSDTIPPSDATEKYSSETAQIVDEIKTLLDTRFGRPLHRMGATSCLTVLILRQASCTFICVAHVQDARLPQRP